MVNSKRWYKCPRCIRYTSTTTTKKGYKCGECEKVYTKEEFLRKSIKEFGKIQFEVEKNG